VLADLAEGAERGTWDRVQRAAHTVKGGLRLFGAVALHDLAEALEAEARGGGVAAAATRIAQLRTRVQTVLQELAAFANKGQLPQNEG